MRTIPLALPPTIRKLLHRRLPRSAARSPGMPGAALLVLVLLGCEGPQSALDPAGRDAERIALLWWWMAGGALLVWAAVVGLALYAIRVRPGEHDRRKAEWLIIGGGAVVPTVVLGGLLTWGLSMMPALLELPADEGLRIEVTGEQFWWRVRYHTPDGGSFESANEVRLPVGRRVALSLSSPDVIHSFWIPALAGKLDMIPGRTTHMAVEPTRTGVFRGVCAEYCGTAHALMAFRAVVLDSVAYAAWLEAEAGPAADPEGPRAERGREVFLENGCGACHTIRGTRAEGLVGPDLTHVGGRLSLGAGILPNDPEGFVRWIAVTDEVKPGVHMPAFGMLPDDDLTALAAYLDGLR